MIIFLFLSKTKEDIAITSSGSQLQQLESPLSNELSYGKEESFVSLIHEAFSYTLEPLFFNLQRDFNFHLEKSLQL